MIYEQLQALEVFSLVFSLLALSMMIGFCIRTKNHCLKLILAGYFFLVMGLFFTNMESIMFTRVFNLLEHLCRVLVPSAVFARAAHNMSKRR
jgi:hypothetical protein